MWGSPGSSVRGISGQEYWSGLPFSPPGDLPNPGIERGSLTNSLPLPHRKPQHPFQSQNFLLKWEGFQNHPWRIQRAAVSLHPRWSRPKVEGRNLFFLGGAGRTDGLRETFFQLCKCHGLRELIRTDLLLICSHCLPALY